MEYFNMSSFSRGIHRHIQLTWLSLGRRKRGRPAILRVQAHLPGQLPHSVTARLLPLCSILHLDPVCTSLEGPSTLVVCPSNRSTANYSKANSKRLLTED